MKTGEIKTGTSYVPSGLSAAEYNKIRKEADDKKKKVYQKNVDKAGKFLGYNEFYEKRGTDLDFKWKSATNGHRMAKTKYDYSKSDDNKVPESFTASGIFGSKIFGGKKK
jgi:hypothetical protein